MVYVYLPHTSERRSSNCAVNPVGAAGLLGKTVSYELLIFDPSDDLILGILYLLFSWIGWFPISINQAAK